MRKVRLIRLIRQLRHPRQLRQSRSALSLLLGGMVAVAVFFAATAFVPGKAVCESKKVKLREDNYYYSAFNRRDPFRSLVAGTFVRNDRMEVVNLNAVELVGVVKGELDRFALLEDDKGFSYILRVGDQVHNGTVVSIGDDSMVARVTNFGQTSKFTLHLVQR